MSRLGPWDLVSSRARVHERATRNPYAHVPQMSLRLETASSELLLGCLFKFQPAGHGKTDRPAPFGKETCSLHLRRLTLPQIFMPPRLSLEWLEWGFSQQNDTTPARKGKFGAHLVLLQID